MRDLEGRRIQAHIRLIWTGTRPISLRSKSKKRSFSGTTEVPLYEFREDGPVWDVFANENTRSTTTNERGFAMAEAMKQAGRLMSVKFSSLAEDTLCIDRASITEGVSKPFAMQLDLLAETSKASSIKYDQIVGKGVTLTVELPGKKKRFFHGMVSRFSDGGQDVKFAHYRAEVVPWLWLLTLTSDCKAFQDLKFPDIIKKVFQEWQGKFPELVKFEDKTSGKYTKVDYCVQYRETDFNFVTRLMEQEGIFYYFKHEDGKHTLVFGDSPSAFEACPNLAEARYLPDAGMGEWEDGVTSWEFRHSMVPGKYALRDHHFQLSASKNEKLEAPEEGAVKVGNNSSLEVFDFPGEFAQRFTKPDERLSEVETHGGDIAKWRMEEQSVPHLVISGTSNCRAFTSGCHFSLLGHGGAAKKVPGTQGKYVLTSLSHSFVQSPDYRSATATTNPYRNTFSCIPQEVTFRPARTTPRPVIQGVQSAVVVGLKGEEIDCDKYGRVKVQFHWDREGKKDEKSSCWVRVGTPWAGKQWGMIHIPRIGQEVIVAFMEGDPDQPLIVGSVYNYDNMPPWELPDNKTKSGIQSCTTKGGGPHDFNGIRFEDKKGEEKFQVLAEKDYSRIVKNNDALAVGFYKKDAGNQTIDIFNNQTVTIGTDAETPEGSQTIEIGKDQKLTVKKGNRDAIIEMGNDSLTIKMGNQTTKLNLGKSATEAMQSIEFKVGQSSIKIDQTGVTIKGMTVNVEGQMLTNVKGMMTQVNGSAMMTVGGGLTMIG
jgi:type VI secretion system secreted protein VgrG